MAYESSLMRRQRIDSLLEKALEKPVVTVIAGPGCGKTCAVNSFMQNSSVRMVWVQLSEADNSPARFWEDVAQAIELHSPGLAEKIRRQEMPANRNELFRFAGLLADEIKPRYRYALVFDDLHLIRDSAVLWFVRALAQGMSASNIVPPGNSVVLISREDCGFDSEKLTAQGRMGQIGAEDLNFTRGETLELFRFMGVPMTQQLLSNAGELYVETEGWAFLTGVAGRLLKKNPDGLKDIRRTLRHNVSMIIENELLLFSSPEMDLFLARFSLLDRLYAGLISRIEGGEEMVRELCRSSSLIRYDASMDEYHVHHMAQDFLRQKQALLGEGERRALCADAAVWCMSHGYKMEAAGYFAQAEDYSGIIGIIYQYPQFIPFDTAQLLFNLLEGIPPELEGDIVSLHSYRGRLLLSLGKIDQAVEEMHAVIREVEPLEDTPGNRRKLMGAHYILGTAGMLTCGSTGAYDFAEHFRNADAYARGSGFAPVGSMRVAALAPYTVRIGHRQAGEPEKYILALEEAVPYVSHMMDGCMYGLDDLARAELSYYRADIASSRRFAMQALFKAREKEQYEIENRALFVLLKIGLATGKYKHIKEATAQMDGQMEQRDFLNRYVHYDIQAGWFYGIIGQKEQIADWLKSDFSVSHSDTVISNYEDIARCKYYLLERNYSAMLAMLSSRTGSFDIARYLFGQIGLEAHKAVCLYNLKDTKGALEALRRAYELAAPNGLDMIFIELGNHMRTLAAAAQKEPAEGIPGAWLETIQTKAATYAKRVGQVRSRYRQEAGLDGSAQLTRKELDLLIDLSHGLSRTEIAAARDISINTVKMMLQYIYEKLGAENSMDAVRLAFAKGLL